MQIKISRFSSRLQDHSQTLCETFQVEMKDIYIYMNGGEGRGMYTSFDWTVYGGGSVSNVDMNLSFEIIESELTRVAKGL